MNPAKASGSDVVSSRPSAKSAIRSVADRRGSFNRYFCCNLCSYENTRLGKMKDHCRKRHPHAYESKPWSEKVGAPQSVRRQRQRWKDIPLKDQRTSSDDAQSNVSSLPSLAAPISAFDVISDTRPTEPTDGPSDTESAASDVASVFSVESYASSASSVATFTISDAFLRDTVDARARWICCIWRALKTPPLDAKDTRRISAG